MTKIIIPSIEKVKITKDTMKTQKKYPVHVKTSTKKKVSKKEMFTKKDMEARYYEGYDAGALDQASVFNKTYETNGYKGWEDEIDVPNLRLYKKPDYLKAVTILLLVVGVVIVLLYGMHMDHESLKDGLIH